MWCDGSVGGGVGGGYVGGEDEQCSTECSRVARVTHVECVCPLITPKLAALIDVNKAVRVIEGCGRKVPRHYKCGSITTP
ncbi:hypothetical protein CK203_060564 [Vitis vinifera]|uniref:Bifunctional inhibitor/plant lipid transfer protein/seed storage helical domain-containing protein n=1 Tax=Vitis vinifera TaxID=29760 RepID=A0A438GDT6_VITVI|nr:hypothetical protein CK203_060564 [Vitis vinifera]